ncbi:protein HIRA isoform X1 [Penaeus vannamei]|uniref:protein HIRA isoform X1 n=1 Tax=Penaeus vannamei TaxID=6689 RepID=UPI00387F9420
MKLLKPPWINHDGDKAIFSVDLHPDGSRFATGGQGQDSSGRVVVWNLKPVALEKYEEDEKVPKLLCMLDQHLGCVNCVRWSQSGRFLASAGDDKVIIIWQQSSYGGGAVFGSNVVNVESWRSVTTLRGHNGDILDVAWSPGDVWLASASVDNNVIVWNTAKWPEQVQILRGHTGLVKGVTWDPVGRYLASQADDKSLRIWRTTDWTTEEKIIDPFSECGGTTTVLRPSWSPDGQYLVSAHAMNNGGPTAQIVERDGWNTDKDFVGHRKPITCVRFNPNILEKADPKTGKSVQYCCVAIGSRDRSISIWFTSLKRPLVVIHDIFDDSVLDLSWSSCGKYLMAVSKDGSLAFINFSPDEIGRPLCEDETNNLHMKLYGKSALTSASLANPTIIENPEFLRLREEEKEKAKEANSEQSRRPAPPTPQRAPINKQIETRTADGKRRITPMFIPPAEGCRTENPNKSYEASFSSSQQEKSKIVVEKVDGVVEPNVTSRPPLAFNSNTNTSPSKGASAPLPAEFNGVPAGLPARFEKSTNGSEKQMDGQITTISSKRKHEDAQPIMVKRKRGRPPLYERAAAPPPNRVPTPPPAQPVVSSRPQAVSHTQGEPLNVLPEASLSKSARVQIPGENSTDGPPPLLIVENDYRIGNRVGMGGGTPSLHRVSRTQLNVVSWVAYLTSQVTAVVATTDAAALTCHDKSLHIFDIKTGEMMLPPVQLQGKASQLFVHENCLMVITTEATLTIWDISKKKRILSETIRHLVEGRNGGVKAVQLTAEGTPVVLLASGEAFTRCHDLEAWLLLGDSASVRRVLQPEYTMLPPCHQSEYKARPLASLLHQTAAYSGSSRVTRPLIPDDAKQNLTEVFINRMLTSAQYLRAAQDYKFWLKRKIQFFIKEGLEKKLRDVFDDLLGPRHSGSMDNQDQNGWMPKIMDFDKKSLLEEFLREILLAENSLQLQRLYSEYKEQLEGNLIDTI